MSGIRQSGNNGDASKSNPAEEYVPLDGGAYMEKSSGHPVDKEEIVPEDKGEKGNGSSGDSKSKS
ncbi:competence protein ComE [Westiellopsis prolifica IICB1]|jgi:muramidase (phage lysozyme)|nr:competence protein ComE [Westiellopsis prolifica IICB1]